MITLNTYVRDIDTNEPLELATILLSDKDGKPLLVNGNQIGRKTDMQGYFVMPVVPKDAYIRVSYIGYETLIHPAEDYVNDIIYLKRKTTGLAPIIIKALRIKKPEERKWWIWLLIALGAGALVYIAYLLFFNKK